MQGIGLPWIGEPAFLAHEATGTVASPPNSRKLWDPSLGKLGASNMPKTSLISSLQPPSPPPFQLGGDILGQVGGALPGKIWGAYLAKCGGALLREIGEAYLDKRWGV